MKSRFEGQEGSRLLHEALLGQKIVGGHSELARDLALGGSLMEVKASSTLIEEGGQDDDVYLILAGSFNVLVNGKHAAVCGPGDHVGEMSPLQSMSRRTATVVAAEDSVLLRLPGKQFANLGEKYPPVWRHLAKELVRRLDHRNAKITKFREHSRILVMAPEDGMEVARAVGQALEKDGVTVSVWADGVFRSKKYSIGRLEEELDDSDFAIAVVAPGKTAAGESEEGRENVIFELGFFIGRLGRNRTLLLEPVKEKANLPADLNGLITLTYRPAARAGIADAVASACERMRAIVSEFGPKR
jgi:CRP/FNR family cyclic AMP-dependent transcriptional regulator